MTEDPSQMTPVDEEGVGPRIHRAPHRYRRPISGEKGVDVVSVEQTEERWIAHVPSMPGCFATGQTADEAVAGVPKALDLYAKWANHQS
jgi:hypothetical protein